MTTACSPIRHLKPMGVRTAQLERPVRLRRWRINILLLLAALIMARVVVQLLNLQVVQQEALATKARNEIDYTVTIQPSRGTIRDRMGNVLALDVDRESLYAVPPLFNREETARLALTLATLTEETAIDIQTKLLDPERAWIPIKRWLSPEVSKQISALIEKDEDTFCIKPGCLQLRYESRRVYPQGAFAAHVIGAVNFEGVGISGVEGFYDSQLKGITGTVSAEWDPQGNPIWLNPPEMRPARNGVDLELTLDPLVQHVIERELRRAVDSFKPKSATVLVMETKTGAIRGMASYPTYDPNRYFAYPPEIYNQNPVIGQIYEPGSTFKVATVAIGLQAGAFDPNTTVNDTGVIQRHGWTLSNWNGGANGPLTPEGVLYYSSNVGALQLNELTGPDTFYQMVGELGYGKPSGIDMAGESPGIVKDPKTNNWNPLDLATNAYGQAIAVTPLQQVRMMAAIGNDGKLMKPYIVQQRCRGETCEETQPQVSGRPFSPEVARTVREMMVTAANHYAPIVWGEITGSYNDAWLVPGYRVSAKTGTSDIPDGEGGYTGRVIGSVLGLAPADEPRYAVLVKIDEPEGDAYGLVSAVPTYQAIVEQLLRYERIAPDTQLVSDGQAIGMLGRP